MIRKRKINVQVLERLCKDLMLLVGKVKNNQNIEVIEAIQNDGNIFKVTKGDDKNDEAFKQEEFDLQNSLEQIVTKIDSVDEFSLF